MVDQCTDSLQYIATKSVRKGAESRVLKMYFVVVVFGWKWGVGRGTTEIKVN